MFHCSDALFFRLYSDFLIGGVTGVMLGMSAADYQYHNTMFLVAHFHYVIIPGVVFAMIAGLTYWWPKMFGFMLNERIGKWAFWVIAISFNVAFFPMFSLWFRRTGSTYVHLF
ncbi:cbb3-type cytochrome c oxidase subunit I [Brevibacillus laterosporus]|uniref:cbb3-type cytochrome c oxidase subunit I n=1 Tax=Brevibacillus laterosporus TaxID=1465 RepID=UPI003AF1B3C0